MSLTGAELIQDCTIELTIGRRYGLLGQNGSGKSNFLKCLAAREVRIWGEWGGRRECDGGKGEDGGEEAERQQEIGPTQVPRCTRVDGEDGRDVG